MDNMYQVRVDRQTRQDVHSEQRWESRRSAEKAVSDFISSSRAIPCCIPPRRRDYLSGRVEVYVAGARACHTAYAVPVPIHWSRQNGLFVGSFRFSGCRLAVKICPPALMYFRATCRTWRRVPLVLPSSTYISECITAYQHLRLYEYQE